jgi:hypothetical protein
MAAEYLGIIDAGSGVDYAAPLTLKDGTALTEGLVDTLTIRLTDHNGAVVNARNDQAVLGAEGDGEIADGVLTFHFSADDVRWIASGRGPTQKRRATFALMTTAGAPRNWEITFDVRRLPGVE